jgi:hypothetical protein
LRRARPDAVLDAGRLFAAHGEGPLAGFFSGSTGLFGGGGDDGPGAGWGCVVAGAAGVACPAGGR